MLKAADCGGSDGASADGSLAENKPNPMSDVSERFGMGPFLFGAYRPLTSPDLPDV
jgi:hypothetical protein